MTNFFSLLWYAGAADGARGQHVVKRAQGGSDFDLDRLVALCPACHAQTDAPYARGRLVITPLGDGRYEAEELRVHHRTTISSEEARAVVVALLASGRVPPVQPARLGIQRPGARPVLQRFWGTVCQRDETIYLILFINDRCLVLALSR